MPTSHDLRRPPRRAFLIAAPAIVAVMVLLARDARHVDDAAPMRATDVSPVAAAPPRVDAPAPRVAPPANAPAAHRDPAPLPRDASDAAMALIADADAARRQGDLRTALALLRAAVDAAPSVATHAALGGLYLELGGARVAEPHLRAAAEGDPTNADRWVALANALALKPDPMAAAGALEQARAADPALDVTRDAGGFVVRVSPH